MAEENDGASKTEEPTPRKLEEARKKGDVAKSADLASFASLAGAFGVLAVGGGWMARDLTMALLPFVAHPAQISLDGAGGVFVAQQATMAALPPLLAVMVAAGVAGFLANFLQHGLLYAPEKIKPELKKISPLGGFKRLFGIDGLVQFLKSALKVILTGVIAWFALRPHADELQQLAAVSPADMLPVSAMMLRDLFFAVLAFLAFMGAVDFLWQRARFMKRMRMSKEELKEEFKQSDGDPHVKAKQRQIRMERSRRRMMQAVPEATVVVMNPTHYAVALKYVAGETPAPECVAKGMDALALKIREVAEEAGVPVIEDPPLARALYAAVEIDEQIPAQHFEAVAKLIGFIMSAAKPRARPL